MAKQKKKNIQCYFGYVKNQVTDKMISEFNSILKTLSGEIAYIKQLDATNPESIEGLVIKSLVTKTLSINQKPKGMIEFDLNVPNWEVVVEEKGIITPTIHPNLTENEIKLCFPDHVVRIKRGTLPFAVGSCRYVYHGYIIDTNTHVVLKENMRDTSSKRYLENHHAHLTAMVYANHFNRDKPVTTESLQFVPPSVLEIKENSKWRHFSVEPFIDGSYEKFNNNAGYVAKSSKISDVVQAFSHYTWQKSGKQFIVCDLQGVVTGSGVLLTDPCIHSCSEELLCYGTSNLGPAGINTFFSTHRCNAVCKEMKLQPYS